MSSAYTDVTFTTRQPDVQTSMKLNRLTLDLSSAIASIGGYYTDTWRWTTQTTDAATSGNVGINATSWAAASYLNISEFSASGADKTVQMDKVIASGNAILIKDAADANNYAEYTFTGAGTDMGTWRQYPVTVVKSGGVLPKNNANTTLTVYVQGGTGSGDMLKSVYDPNGNGIVQTCESLPWANVTGKPSTFPPDSTAMLKSVYDTNVDNIVDHAALADTAPWTGITGKPSTFPPDSTAMLKSVYDTNGNGIVDTADAIGWTAVTGKPSTFPPDSTAMLKSVYDTNGNNKVDSAESADAVPWTGVSGKPTSFTPATHGTTHLDNGSDPVPVATTVRTGLLPKLNGNAGTYLDGTGNFSGVSGSVNPGTWTNLSLGSGWTAPTQAQYRVEVNGAVSTVYFRGTIQSAYSNLSTSPFTVPAIGQPSMTRRCVLAGAQNTGTASDVAAYIATVSNTGVCMIFFLTGGPFTWADPAQTQIVALDGLQYSL